MLQEAIIIASEENKYTLKISIAIQKDKKLLPGEA